MAEQRSFDRKSLGELVQRLTAAGYRFVAPVRRGQAVRFAEVTSVEQVELDYLQTGSSAKPVVFPRYEPLLRYELSGKELALEEVRPDARPTVLFGVHPCDAASLATLRAVFTWDSPDAYFEPRLENLTVVGLACTRADQHCFCTSVGGGPGDTRGSDILLTPTTDGRFRADILTERGAALAKLAPQVFGAPTGELKTAPLAQVPVRFAAGELSARLAGLFGREELWIEQSLRCIGCGACAYVCPTCSCFDIQDERVRDQGVRLRCWDSCGFKLFTLHASGHNPRTRQFERWRQRVMHKFAYQPERLGVLGCVGCGRCSRACPADMELAEHLKALAETGA